MHYKLRGFIETTLPIVLLYGLAILILTNFFSWVWGLIGVIIFTITHIWFTIPSDFVPRNIEYQGEYFKTLTELIDYVKENSANQPKE